MLAMSGHITLRFVFYWIAVLAILLRVLLLYDGPVHTIVLLVWLNVIFTCGHITSWKTSLRVSQAIGLVYGVLSGAMATVPNKLGESGIVAALVTGILLGQFIALSQWLVACTLGWIYNSVIRGKKMG